VHKHKQNHHTVGGNKLQQQKHTITVYYDTDVSNTPSVTEHWD